MNTLLSRKKEKEKGHMSFKFSLDKLISQEDLNL